MRRCGSAVDVYQQLAAQGGAHQRQVSQPDLLIAAASQSTRFTGTATAMNAKTVRAAGKARPVRVVHAVAESEPVTG